MKERQRWQPEEDALLRAYVKQYGPKEWNLLNHRMGRPLHRDPKSCLERWKNYLKPGIKKGSLTPEEQSLVISLQAKYGNKWKKIAAEVPGRTAKRLGKWWEVFKEKQQKLLHKNTNLNLPISASAAAESPETAVQGRYDHILETFAEKYVQPKLYPFGSSDPDPVLSLGSVPPPLPPWMSANPAAEMDLGTVTQYCKEVEEERENWAQHKKEATWRLRRLEQQLEAEKARKMREKTEEIEEAIRRLREEEIGFMEKMESEYRDELSALQREAESKEAKLMEAWSVKHSKLLHKIGSSPITTHCLKLP